MPGGPGIPGFRGSEVIGSVLARVRVAWPARLAKTISDRLSSTCRNRRWRGLRDAPPVNARHSPCTVVHRLDGGIAGTTAARGLLSDFGLPIQRALSGCSFRGRWARLFVAAVLGAAAPPIGCLSTPAPAEDCGCETT